MAKDCYLEIDGKRTKLTDEQLKALGLYEEPKENPFERTQRNKEFYYISFVGEVEDLEDGRRDLSDKLFDVANYCTDKSLMQQRALHETLNRLLWRFSMENDGDKIDWETDDCKYLVGKSRTTKLFHIHRAVNTKCLEPHFYTREIAERAIDEIIKPFIKKHPDFVW